MRLCGGEEHLCSLLADTACKPQPMLPHSLFLCCFVVLQFRLPAVQLGGQPRHWAVELGFSPMCTQKIPQNTLLSYGLEAWKASDTPRLLASACVALPQTYQWHRCCVRPVVSRLLGLSTLAVWTSPCSPARSHTLWLFLHMRLFSLTIKWSYISDIGAAHSDRAAWMSLHFPASPRFCFLASTDPASSVTSEVSVPAGKSLQNTVCAW